MNVYKQFILVEGYPKKINKSNTKINPTYFFWPFKIVKPRLKKLLLVPKNVCRHGKHITSKRLMVANVVRWIIHEPNISSLISCQTRGYWKWNYVCLVYLLLLLVAILVLICHSANIVNSRLGLHNQKYPLTRRIFSCCFGIHTFTDLDFGSNIHTSEIFNIFCNIT